MSVRIGPKMEQVRFLVAESMSRGVAPRPIDIARVVGPNGSLRFGYLIIARAVKARMVRHLPDPAHKGRSFLDLAL